MNDFVLIKRKVRGSHKSNSKRLKSIITRKERCELCNDLYPEIHHIAYDLEKPFIVYLCKTCYHKVRLMINHEVWSIKGHHASFKPIHLQNTKKFNTLPIEFIEEMRKKQVCQTIYT